MVNGWTSQLSVPPLSAAVTSPSDSPTISRSISSRREPSARSIDQTRNGPPPWPATYSRPSMNVAPVMPLGGTAPRSRRTEWIGACSGAALAAVMSAVR